MKKTSENNGLESTAREGKIEPLPAVEHRTGAEIAGIFGVGWPLFQVFHSDSLTVHREIHKGR
jgi:hypothetical protein